MLHTDYVAGLAGGVLIGLAATLLLWTHGRIAGISGIAGALLNPGSGQAWRWQFVAGLFAAGLAYHLTVDPVYSSSLSRSAQAIVAGGLLVGFGTRWAHGCTSGHGVCGLSRRSRRSLIATLTFMLTGIVTVWLIRALFGGAM
ncbi:MAG: YeeE/YedE family protein [Acidobacteriota bacterium]